MEAVHVAEAVQALQNTIVGLSKVIRAIRMMQLQQQSDAVSELLSVVREAGLPAGQALGATSPAAAILASVLLLLELSPA